MMECFLAATDCQHHTCHDQCPSSFGSSEFLRKTAWLVTPAVTFTNSRPVAVHRRKHAVTKTNEGGSERWASAWRGGMDVSIHQPAPFPGLTVLPPGPRARHPHTIYLRARGSWGLRPRFWWICLCQSLPARPLQVGSSNKHVHLPRLPSSTSPLEENEKNVVKLKKNSPDQDFRGMKSNIW